MKTPPYLNPGDKIGIVATARKISEMELCPAIKKFNEWGFEVVLGNNIYAEENQYAGNDELRRSDFQQMLDDPSVKAIICARGGYGTIRIIDKIDFSLFEKNPKWIIGYSDVTALHSHIHTNYRVETLHATMPLNFPVDGYDNEALQTLKTALTGEKLNYKINHSILSRQGNASGMLVGGNLSLLYALASTPSDINTSGKILFIEDLDEYLYHVDRMMMQLKRSGKLKNLVGLIVGGMTEMKDNTIPFGRTAYEIVADTVKEYDYPVCVGFPAGHTADNRALILGRTLQMEVRPSETIIEFQAMAKHHELGAIGEKAAREFLKGKGYKILDYNWRYLKDELDIIATVDNKLIVIEVKTRSSWQYGEPHEAVTPKKQKFIIRATEAYINEKNIELEVRFDVISIVMENNSVADLTHIEDAFYATM